MPEASSALLFDPAAILAALLLLLVAALALRRAARRVLNRPLPRLGGTIGMLLNVCAYGFGNATGKQDPLRSPEHFFHIGVWKVGATATNVRTGRLVVRSAAGKVQAAGDEAINVLGICRRRTLQASSGERNPAWDRAADFATNDEVEVASPMPGALCDLVLASGENVTAGTQLVIAAGGKLKAYAPDTTATVNETTVEAALAENAGRVAKAMEDCDASAADTAILVKWGSA